MKLTYPRAIALVRRNMVDLRSLVTHRFPLERGAEAFQLVADYGDSIIKAVVCP